MSIEQLIEENTKAINRLTNTLLDRLPKDDGSKEQEVSEPKAEKKAPVKKPVEKKAPAAKPASSSTLTYEDVKKATLALVKDKGREVATSLLAEYGVEKAPDLTEDQWEAYVEAAKAKTKTDEDLA